MSGVLTDGFQAEVTLTYDGIIAQEKAGRPFKVDGLRPIQVSKSDVLDIYDADLLLGQKRRRVVRRMSLMVSSAGCFSGPDFCLIFAPCGYDDPEIFPA